MNNRLMVRYSHTRAYNRTHTEEIQWGRVQLMKYISAVVRPAKHHLSVPLSDLYYCVNTDSEDLMHVDMKIIRLQQCFGYFGMKITKDLICATHASVAKSTCRVRICNMS